MSLPPLYGHEDLRRRFAAAAREGRLPQSLLLHGPEGAGKERLAQWIAALLLCRSERERPCGACRSCRLAAGLQHPDIHWFFPVPSPKGSLTPEKRREKLEEARLEVLAALREDPLRPRGSEPSDALFLQVVDEIRARASRRPAMAEGAVFVVAEAERLVPQASSPEAANALLKLLEEPGPDTVFLLTSSRPGLLLPTIRSRLLAVRVAPPEVATAARFLEKEAGLPPERAAELARRAGGAIGTALRLQRDEEPESGRPAALRLVRTALEGDRAACWAEAAAFGPAGARGAFSRLLEAVEEVLRDCLTVSAGVPAAALDPDLARALPGAAAVPPDRWLSAIERVEEARDAASGNLNPEAIAAVLLRRMARALRPPEPAEKERPRTGRGIRGP
ncbi:MAG: hypothetical protein R6X22_06680 [Gemmatimonadota bacterium]